MGVYSFMAKKVVAANVVHVGLLHKNLKKRSVLSYKGLHFALSVLFEYAKSDDIHVGIVV